jgi:hypothetical protein
MLDVGRGGGWWRWGVWWWGRKTELCLRTSDISGWSMRCSHVTDFLGQLGYDGGLLGTQQDRVSTSEESVNDLVHIPRRSLIEELRLAIPDFIIKPESANLEYIVVCDFARYICDHATTKDFRAVQRAIDFMEELVSLSDSNSRNLIAEGLESLQVCDCFEEIKTYFGPKMLAIWKSMAG